MNFSVVQTGSVVGSVLQIGIGPMCKLLVSSDLHCEMLLFSHVELHWKKSVLSQPKIFPAFLVHFYYRVVLFSDAIKRSCKQCFVTKHPFASLRSC